MKKALTIFIIIIIFLILYFLQANFFSWFTIGEIQPNLFVVFVLMIGLFAGRKMGIGLGIAFGLYLDIIMGKGIGISAVMFAVIGFLGGYFDKSFSKDSKITIMFMVMGATAVYEIGSYTFSLIAYEAMPEIIHFLKILVIEVLYNMILSIILYPIIQRVGYKMEEIFKSKNILTRYF